MNSVFTLIDGADEYLLLSWLWFRTVNARYMGYLKINQ